MLSHIIFYLFLTPCLSELISWFINNMKSANANQNHLSWKCFISDSLKSYFASMSLQKEKILPIPKLSVALHCRRQQNFHPSLGLIMLINQKSPQWFDSSKCRTKGRLFLTTSKSAQKHEKSHRELKNNQSKIIIAWTYLKYRSICECVVCSN